MTRTSTVHASLMAAIGAGGMCLLMAPMPGHPIGWLLPVVVALGAGLAVLLGRIAWKAFSHHRLTRQLRAAATPATLAGVGVKELAGVENAFVAGLRRPDIFCSPQLAALLEPDELRGVLLHERYHQLDRAPAKMVVLEAVAPVVGVFQSGRAWLAYRLASLEIAADRHALEQGTSRGALARALLKLAPMPTRGLGVGFASAVDLRLQALIEERPAEPASFAPTWLIAPIVAVALCLLLVLAI
ncbi:MAG: M48 family metalloprotease [Acidimicrobiales bacterium]